MVSWSNIVGPTHNQLLDRAVVDAYQGLPATRAINAAPGNAARGATNFMEIHKEAAIIYCKEGLVALSSGNPD